MHSMLAALGLFSLCCTSKCKKHASRPDGGIAKRGTKMGILCFLSLAQILLRVCSFIVVFFSLK